MRFDDWRWSKQIENDFRKDLEKLVGIFDRIVKRTRGNVEEYQSSMKTFQESFEFDKFILKAVKRMVTPLARANYSTWRQAARKLSRSRLIYRALMGEIDAGIKVDIQQQIIENANLIKTLPTDTANKVVNDVRDYAFEGMRASEIAQIIRKYTDQHSRASARLIARTEVSKTSTALTQARCKNLGLDWYVWRTALDGNRVRKSHQIMEGVLVKWSNPPSPERLAGEKDVGNYHAGGIWNCRCYAEPLLELDDVRWPAKVYHDGQIERMSKAKFEALNGGQFNG